MKYNYLDNWDIMHIKSITDDTDLLLATIDNMLSNIADTTFQEGYDEGYDQGYDTCRDAYIRRNNNE